MKVVFQFFLEMCECHMAWHGTQHCWKFEIYCTVRRCGIECHFWINELICK